MQTTDLERSGLRAGQPSALLVLGVLLVAANLRPALAGVGPVIDVLQHRLGLSAGEAALLTALPVACFGVAGGFVPRLMDRVGLERLLAAALAALTAGLLLRSGPSVSMLFAGTMVAGSAIAVCNVLVPTLVKRDFARHVGLLTGLYTASLGAAAALAAGLAVPLTEAAGWRVGLGVWSLPSAVALVVWAVLARRRGAPAVRHHRGRAARGSLLRNALAWQVTLFMSMQSLTYFAVLAWLPSVYQAQGVPAAEAGLLLALVTLVGIPMALVVPMWAARSTDQRRFVAALVGMTVLGLVGLVLAPTGAPVLWAVLIGAGLGGNFPLALTLVVLRAGSPTDAAALSAMSQSVGFALAATGPLMVGRIHDVTGDWAPALLVLVLVAAVQLVFGLAAGRRRVLAR